MSDNISGLNFRMERISEVCVNDVVRIRMRAFPTFPFHFWGTRSCESFTGHFFRT